SGQVIFILTKLMAVGREEVAEQATMAAEQEVGEDHRASWQRKPSKTIKEAEQACEGSRADL
ncbi:hypothetical protein Dimus_003829, partial [Dionaea muscipula]